MTRTEKVWGDPIFSTASGTVVARDGVEYLHVRRDAVGHVVHGPYAHIRPGRLRVDFTVELAEGERGDPNQHVVTLDVAAYNGAAILARANLTRSQVVAGRGLFSLFLDNREFRSLEYRVQAVGTAALVVGRPKLVRVGDVSGPAPEPDPMADSDDPVEIHRQARAVLRQLRPQRVTGRLGAPAAAGERLDKVRLGNAGDGGYVCIDDFRPGDVALSLGINDDISWDLDAADRGMTIYQFDHTVDDPEPDDPRMIFERKMVTARSSATSVSLPDLIRAHDRSEARPNLVLKMDIEGHEWEVLEVTSAEELSRFSQILCEFHCFEWLGETTRRRLLHQCLSRIARHFAVIHVHGNVCGGIINVANVVLPSVLEFTFVNRSLYALADTDELFPGPLDISCDAYQPDFYLGSFRF